MGLVTAKLRLSNPRNPSSLPVDVNALADTGCMFLCIPQHVCLQLGLDALQEREVRLADGSCVSVPYVGPVLVQFKNRTGVIRHRQARGLTPELSSRNEGAHVLI